MKRIVLILFVLWSFVSLAQKKRSSKIGKTTLAELQMKSYDRDSIANAVVLYEHANYYVNEQQNFNLTTDYYFRIKILKKEGFEKATISIPLSSRDKIENIKAETYNLDGSQHLKATALDQKKIYTKNKLISFTLPNVKVGSVIEYQYSITTPSSKIRDWYFQSDIPKIKSEFTAAILGNYKYDIRVVGSLKLTKDVAVVKKNCVYVPIIGVGACLDISYGIDNIPAFKEEDFMLSKRNYISRLNFKLNSYTKVNGMVKNFSKTWKAADKSIKNLLLDGQNSKSKYFQKSIIPKEFFLIEDELSRSAKVYDLIKNNFNWNGLYWPTRKVNVKNAFVSKTGNIFDINLSLYNALKAVGVNCNIALISTRNKGLPTKLYPTVSDFNYLVVKAIINGKTYFLDASDKLLPFGLVRFNALNGDARILDFKKGSYWETIQLNRQSSVVRKISLTLIDNSLVGNLSVVSDGYSAIEKRRAFKNSTTEEVLNYFETNNPSIEADKLILSNLDSLDKKLIERYKVNIDSEIAAESTTLINPFYFKAFEINPFKLKNRTFPVDFGYKRAVTYILSLKLPQNYSINKLPKNRSMSLPNKGGRILFSVNKKDKVINLYLKFTVKRKRFNSDEYEFLKEYFNQLAKIQESIVEIKKN